MKINEKSYINNKLENIIRKKGTNLFTTIMNERLIYKNEEYLKILKINKLIIKNYFKHMSIRKNELQQLKKEEKFKICSIKQHCIKVQQVILLKNMEKLNKHKACTFLLKTKLILNKKYFEFIKLLKCNAYDKWIRTYIF